MPRLGSKPQRPNQLAAKLDSYGPLRFTHTAGLQLNTARLTPRCPTRLGSKRPLVLATFRIVHPMLRLVVIWVDVNHAAATAGDQHASLLACSRPSGADASIPRWNLVWAISVKPTVLATCPTCSCAGLTAVQTVPQM